jgi:hypothetical protein
MLEAPNAPPRRTPSRTIDRLSGIKLAVLATILVRLRIMATPHEQELDGVKLDKFIPGTVRDVSPAVALWLIAQGYADVEMRTESEVDPDSVSERIAIIEDRRRKHR